MKFYIVDCFAEQKYQGNQLAVFIPDRELSTEEMQQIAREINFSETTFILSGKESNGGYRVRIFTPDIEVPFAGHPTLGTAFVIHREIEQSAPGKVVLNLDAGPIPVEIESDGLTMTQNQPEFGQTIEKSQVAGLLQIDEEEIREDYPIQWVSTGLPCFVIPLRDQEAVKKCAIHHERFANFIDTVYKCNMLVFAETGEDRLAVRVFMDDPGFLEDPATGSANGNLAGYLLKHHYFKRNIVDYTVNQGGEIGRPSTLRIHGALSGDAYQIKVGGNAYLVAQGLWN
jgi:trans-2,3-dihydro-3-hydroxyanthranilate isomerase